MEPLFDPGVFGNPYGIPSLNMDHPEYGKPSSEDDSAGGRPFDYWRGNIWPPSSYLVFQGLKRYALDTEAAEFARRHVENWKALYERTGHNPEMLNPVTGRMGGMTFEYHQSWGSLFGLMGVEELMDAEFWKLGALRFGTHQPSTMEEIRNVRIRDTVYSMRVDGNSTVLFANGEELLSGPAETVYRDFVFDEATVRFSANSKRGGPVKIRGKHALDLKPGLQRFG
jgi:glycogen debranching enzyme